MTLASMKTAPLPLIVLTELRLRVLASIHKGRFNPLTHCSPHLLGVIAPFSQLYYPARYSVWWYSMAQSILASLFATATTALCLPRRSITFLAQRDSRSVERSA